MVNGTVVFAENKAKQTSLLEGRQKPKSVIQMNRKCNICGSKLESFAKYDINGETPEYIGETLECPNQYQH